jgi:hypothetical protein
MSLDVNIRAVVPTTVFDGNLTHNLGRMAAEANLYYPLWRPEELGLTKAGDLIPFLEAGLYKLTHYREDLEKHNPPNGWGDYHVLVRFVEDYLAACREFPEGDIKVCR